ncbi:DUF1905 domain-containing protein [Microbacterium paludicola]|uniref:DUF1905 domain-containing protein n=1 Tax=Microbacterium paludicola TaxID=300019 RepID=A0A4Y9FWA3_9MICO|nr:DUF1905 domain-containing protein [Microbacterium paludicola]MBF0815731.1 DUF1905 domain-containing protein [Microbacterium paludicola]TFU33569.1 DUF1905 domain-containing protein [Microbacterium paludicola]
MAWDFEAELIEWRGPAPFVFAPLPPELFAQIKDAARGLMYWGQIPVIARIGDTEFDTAMWPKDGRFLLPIKVAVQRSERIDVGDVVTAVVRLPDERG